MKTIILYFILYFVLVFPVFAFSGQENKILRFHDDGTFKIAQFTDIHFKPGVPESQAAIELIIYVLETEKPDMVVFTGDIVTGKPAREGWKAILAPVTDRNVPFAVTLGNHDDEHDMTRAEIMKMLSGYPGFAGKYTSVKAENGDCVIPLKGSENDSTEALLYCMDSNAYTTLETVGKYGWFLYDQVNWYREQSSRFAGEVKSALPALAFFHIPLPEYREAFDSKAKRVGVRKEDECSPVINTGIFAAMRIAGDVLGTFVGHDHVNNYIVNHHGIALAYGMFSGGKTTYTPKTNGSRIIVLEQGARRFQTWLRLRDGNTINRVVFPDDLKSKPVK